MKNIKFIIEYDGTEYCGWQIQPNGLSVQQVIEEALLKLTGEEIKIHGSGRTDSGVHAYGQAASFKTQSSIPAEVFSKALNHHLPWDISIIFSCEADKDFHARFSAKGKKYSYEIFNRDIRSPFYETRAFRVPGTLDINSMKRAAEHFYGTHDFRGFMAVKSQVSDTVRTITDISVEKNGDIIEINVSGNGFLYNMVRIIAGTLLECGLGRLAPSDIPNVIFSGKRDEAGPTLPARGLYLVNVFYS